MRPALIMTILLLPSLALAAGGGDSSPPKPTQTTKTCQTGLVWDTKTKTCVAPKDSSNGYDRKMRDVRELAHAGRFDDARAVLALMDASDPWVLTYRGFLARKAGDLPRAMAYYASALETDPDHLLARSYMGQGLVEAGNLGGARVQLAQIRARGGTGSWAEGALASAIETGRGYSF